MSVLPPELLTGFLAEARDYVASLREAIARCNGAPERALLEEIHDKLDILGGSAEVLGLEPIIMLARPGVDRLNTLITSDAKFEDTDYRGLVTTLDQIESSLDRLSASEDDSPAPNEPVDAGPALPDLPPELWETFLLEVEDHNQAIQRALDTLRATPDDQPGLRELRRVTHTLKGAAATVGVVSMARAAHLMEDLIDYHLDTRAPLTDDTLALLFDSADLLAQVVEPGRAGQAADGLKALETRYQAVLNDTVSTEPKPGTSPPDAVESGLPRFEPAAAMLRVPLPSIDTLTNHIGEVAINRAGLEKHLGSLREYLHDLEHSTKRLRGITQTIDAEIETTRRVQTGDPGGHDPAFDPLEMDRYSRVYQLTRELEELAADATDINRQLHLAADDLERGINRERRLTNELQTDLLTTRLVPFFELETRVRRTVYRTARDLGKQVEFVLAGFDTKIDKTILNTLADPLMHLLRNAVDHGIESSEVRAQHQKPPVGTITVHVRRERGRVVVRLSDDGAGIDVNQVRQKASALNIVSPGAELSESQLFDLLFTEGFSLAEHVTQTSGRGVGLDIVRRAVNRLQGTVSVQTRLGHGTVFTISVPVTLAIIPALFVASCGQRFAVPLEQVNMVLRLDASLVDAFHEQGLLRYDGRTFTGFDLAQFVGSVGRNGAASHYGLLLEQNDTIILVDGVAGIHETVVKPLGAHLQRVPGVLGATIAGDGSVTLILDLFEVISSERTVEQEHPPGVRSGQPGVTSTPLVLVVDDSPSVRRAVCGFLERVGWRTSSAKDGIDALEQLARIRPDVAVVDIEMPRMNGYELLSRIKSDQILSRIPVVFLTSRAAAKHRDRAAHLGVDGYLVKPYREDQLLDELTRVMRDE
jgi:chemosensory pili system protein ChpA (sensor histidine kinase/response regulator)